MSNCHIFVKHITKNLFYFSCC